jgi:hypothetical protein
VSPVPEAPPRSELKSEIALIAIAWSTQANTSNIFFILIRASKKATPSYITKLLDPSDTVVKPNKMCLGIFSLQFRYMFPYKVVSFGRRNGSADKPNRVRVVLLLFRYLFPDELFSGFHSGNE